MGEVREGGRGGGRWDREESRELRKGGKWRREGVREVGDRRDRGGEGGKGERGEGVREGSGGGREVG